MELRDILQCEHLLKFSIENTISVYESAIRLLIYFTGQNLTAEANNQLKIFATVIMLYRICKVFVRSFVSVNLARFNKELYISICKVL